MKSYFVPYYSKWAQLYQDSKGAIFFLGYIIQYYVSENYPIILEWHFNNYCRFNPVDIQIFTFI